MDCGNITSHKLALAHLGSLSKILNAANAPVLFWTCFDEYRKSTLNISYKLEFVVLVYPILLSKSTGHYFRSAKFHTMPLFKSQRTMRFNMHVNRYIYLKKDAWSVMS